MLMCDERHVVVIFQICCVADSDTMIQEIHGSLTSGSSKYIYSYLMEAFASMCHMLSKVYTHIPCWHTCG
jgi:hypothetical protein